MFDDWQDVSVAEIAAPTPNAMATGPFGSSIGSRLFTESGVPLIRGSNLSDHVGLRLLNDDLVYVSEETAAKFGRSVVTDGDLVFTCWGTVGQVGLIDRRCPYRRYLISNKQMKLTPNQSVADSLFLYYLFSGPEVSGRIRKDAIGSSVPGYNLSQLRALRVRLPGLRAQRAISDVLGSLDDKIDLNRRMNETLDTMAQALFRSWFVDFDPVRAKSAGRQPAGMDAMMAALFSDRLVNSGLGEVPLGWKLRPLDQVAHFLNGLALQKYPPVDGRHLPAIKIAQLRRGSSDDSDLVSADVPSEYVVRDGDVLFSWSGSLLVSIWAGGLGALNQHLFKVTSADYPKWFYFYWCREHLPEFQRIAQAKATTMGHIQRYHLTNALVAVPSGELLDAANCYFEPLFRRWLVNALETRTLAQLRDALLPKLLSGEIRVRDAEAAVAASA